jgi:hypothetical protein
MFKIAYTAARHKDYKLFSIVSNFNHSEQKARILLRAASGGEPPAALYNLYRLNMHVESPETNGTNHLT